MRSDMAKVVTERPRRGHGDLGKKWGRRLRKSEYDAEDHGPSRAPIARHHQYGWNAKEFSDLLGPLRRYLRRHLGAQQDPSRSRRGTIRRPAAGGMLLASVCRSPRSRVRRRTPWTWALSPLHVYGLCYALAVIVAARSPGGAEKPRVARAARRRSRAMGLSGRAWSAGDCTSSDHPGELSTTGGARSRSGRAGWGLGRDRARRARRALARPARRRRPARFMDAGAPALLVARRSGGSATTSTRNSSAAHDLPWGLEIDPGHRPDGYAAERRSTRRSV